MTGSRNIREMLQFWPALQLQRLHAAALHRVETPPVIAGLVVSVTSYPARFGTLPLCLASLLRQSMRPERLVLAVSVEEARRSPLPPVIQELDGSRIEVLHDDGNIGSYKKIIPVLERFPDHTIVTCDDDKIYPPNWLKQLLRASHQTPEAIICHRARLGQGLSGSNWAPYTQWPSCDHSRPAMDVFPIGSAGVLYPPASLDPVVTKRHLALDLAPTADDLWFKYAAWKGGRPARQVRRKPFRFTSIPVNSGHLSDKNLTGGNDITLQRMARELGFTPNAVLQHNN